MFRHLTKTITALGLSLVLGLSAIGASATPARADANDAARLLGGIIALYALGRALDNGRRGNSHVTQQYQYHPPYQPQTNHRFAPARCLRSGHSYNGFYRGYSQRCMQNSVALPDLLPYNCLRQIHTHNGLRSIFGRHCLARNGWVFG